MVVEKNKAVYAGGWFIIIMILAAMACNLNKKDEDSQSADITPPTITIVNPPTAGVVGELLTIQVEAVDPSGSGVTEVELVVDNILVNSKQSQDPSGVTPFQANLTWTPPTGTLGTVTIRARASRGILTGESAPIQVNIVAAGTQLTQTPGSSDTGTGGTGGGTSPTGPGYCAARVDTQGLRFRSHPDTSSDAYIISSFNLNDTPPVVGQLSDGSWYQVTKGSQQGWVFGGYVELLDCENTAIPVRAAPATFTPVPSPTLEPSEEPHPADLIALIAGNVAIQLDNSGSATASYIITLQNVGGMDSDEFDVEIILPGGNSITKTVTNLGPNEQVQISEDDSGVQAITFTQPGTRQLWVLVDVNGDVDEANENNNNVSLAIIVEAPDDPNQAPEE